MKTISFGGIAGGPAALAKKGAMAAKKGLHAKPTLAGIKPRKPLTADALQLSKKSTSIKPR